MDTAAAKSDMPAAEHGPLVSVIIPAYNVEKFIADTLSSVAAQTYKHFEVIIVDDGSTDNTHMAIEPFTSNHNFKYIRQENRGVSAARNTAVRHSTGSLVAFLDGDDLWMPDKLEKQIVHFQDPRVVLSATNFAYMSEEGADLDCLAFSEYPHELVANPRITLFRSRNVCTCTAMLRRDSFMESGGFDEDLSWSEDTDLFLRVLDNGGELRFLMEPLSKIRCRSGSLMENTVGSRASVLRMYEKALAHERTLTGRLVLRQCILQTKSGIYSTSALSFLPDDPYRASVRLIMSWLCHPRRLRALLWGLGLLMPSFLGGRTIRQSIHAAMKRKIWQGGRKTPTS